MSAKTASASYVEQMKAALDKLEDAPGHTYGKARLSAEAKDGIVTLTLDTLPRNYDARKDGERATKLLSELLDQQGIKHTVVDQYVPLEAGRRSAAELEANPKGINKPKLVVTLPDTMDSVISLNNAHRNAIIEREGQTVAHAIFNARGRFTRALGETAARAAEQEMLAGLGLSQQKKRGR